MFLGFIKLRWNIRNLAINEWFGGGAPNGKTLNRSDLILVPTIPSLTEVYPNCFEPNDKIIWSARQFEIYFIGN